MVCPMLSENILKNVSSLRNNSSELREVLKSLREKHSQERNVYLDKFITFQGAISIVALLFTSSSSLVKNPSLAILGVILITISLLIVLNILRKEINFNRNFMKVMNPIEESVSDFNKKTDQILKSELDTDNSKILLVQLESVQKLMNRYGDSFDRKTFEKEENLGYCYINLSFFLLILGIVFSFLATIPPSTLINWISHF